MPHFRICLTSSDGSLENPDPEGVTLDTVGEARALAVETLVDAAREAPRTSRAVTITVTLEDERGAVIYRDFAMVGGSGPNPDDASVGRAIRVMGRASA